jgi:Phosphodiester glycosidase
MDAPRSPVRSVRRAVLGMAAIALVGLLVAPPAVQATVAPRVVKHTYHPRSGLTLTTTRYGSGPMQVRVLQFSPTSNGYTIEPGAPGAVISTHAKPSTMAANQGAIATINGDFGLNGQPAHFNAVDADVRTSGLLRGAGFAITKDEDVAWADRPDPAISLEASDGDAFKIDTLNAGQPNNAEVAAFTHAGGSRQAPGNGMCSARFINPTARVWTNAGRAGIARTYDVGQKVCQADPLPVGSDPGTIVLTGKRGTVGGDLVDALPTSGTVTIDWKMAGWPGITESIGGQPVIVDKGQNVGPPPTTGSSYFYKPNPRSAVGITKGCTDATADTTCTVIYMTVDGRQEGWSVGMTLKELGAEMLKYHAYYAVNIDGGGGTTMWLKDKGPWCITNTNGGCLVNKPSDAVGERATLSALMILPGRDTNEPPIGSSFSRAAADAFGTSIDDTSVDWDALALQDPASTGGLLDALAEQGSLPASLRPDLRTYRASLTRG